MRRIMMQALFFHWRKRLRVLFVFRSSTAPCAAKLSQRTSTMQRISIGKKESSGSSRHAVEKEWELSLPDRSPSVYSVNKRSGVIAPMPLSSNVTSAERVITLRGIPLIAECRRCPEYRNDTCQGGCLSEKEEWAV